MWQATLWDGDRSSFGEGCWGHHHPPGVWAPLVGHFLQDTCQWRESLRIRVFKAWGLRLGSWGSSEMVLEPENVRASAARILERQKHRCPSSKTCPWALPVLDPSSVAAGASMWE